MATLRVEQQFVYVLGAFALQAAHELVDSVAVLDWVGLGVAVPFQLKADFVFKKRV